MTLRPSDRARQKRSTGNALYVENRAKALARDGYQCRAWGWSALVGQPTVCAGNIVCHHIEAAGMGRPRNHSLDNLMACCERHHEMIHSHPKQARDAGFLK